MAASLKALDQPSPFSNVDVETTRQLLMRWTGAAFCVAALHAGTAFAIINWPRPALPSGEPPAAIMIELAPCPWRRRHHRKSWRSARKP